MTVVVIYGCGDSQDCCKGVLWSRFVAWVEGVPPADRNRVQNVRPDSYPEEKLFLEKILGDGFAFDWKSLSGKRWSRTDSDRVQIDWFRNDSKLVRQKWIGLKDRIDSYFVYFYLGRRFLRLDDVLYEDEQYIEVEFNLQTKEILWGIECGYEEDPIMDEIRDCMKEVWKLNGMNDKRIFCWCPLDQHEEFMKILLRALQINDTSDGASSVQTLEGQTPVNMSQ